MTVKEKQENNFEFKNVWNQYFATFAVDLIMLTHGAAACWSSPALPILSSEDTPLVSGKLTTDEISWIGSVISLGAVIGAISAGYLISLMGPKHAIILFAIPEAAAWLLIYFGNHYYHIIISRVMSGIGGAGLVCALVLYISDIANDDIRGRLISSMMILRNIGILTIYILGASVDYSTMPLIVLVFPVIFLIFFVMLPNTPQYHLQRGQSRKAEKAFKFYKGYKGYSKEEDDAFSKEFGRLESNSSERKTEERVKLSDFLNRSTLRGLMICLAFNTFTELTANHVIKTYAVTIFKITNTTIDEHFSSIVLSLMFIVGSFLSSYLADIIGRKILNITSLAGSALGLFTLSIYYKFHINGYDVSEFQWVPVVSLSFVIFISSAGINALAYVCSLEYLPLKIRTSGYAVIIVWLNITGFVYAKLFPVLLDIIDLHGCMTIFGIGSTVGAIFVAFATEETSGKSLDDVGLDGKATKNRVSVPTKC